MARTSGGGVIMSDAKLALFGWTAPFTFIGCTIHKYQACHGAPVQPGTSCDRCGESLMYAFNFRDAAGLEFRLGCDCAARTLPDYDSHARAMRRSRRAAEVAEMRAGQNERERNENEAAGLGRLTHRELREIAQARHREERLAEAKRIRAEREERASRSQHVGTVGEKIEVVVTYEFRASFETQFGISWVHGMRDEAGNQIVYIGSGNFCGPESCHFPTKGSKLRIKGTVKELGEREYAGIVEKQTKIQRAKITEVLWAAPEIE